MQRSTRYRALEHESDQSPFNKYFCNINTIVHPFHLLQSPMPPPMPLSIRRSSDQDDGDNEPESTVPEGELPVSEEEDHIQMQNVASPMQVAGKFTNLLYVKGLPFSTAGGLKYTGGS